MIIYGTERVAIYSGLSSTTNSINWPITVRSAVLFRSGNYYHPLSSDTDRSAAYDFLLTFHSNHGPISYRFREINGDFSRKSQIFPIRVYFAPPLKVF